jgi:hypothetical protein
MYWLIDAPSFTVKGSENTVQPPPPKKKYDTMNHPPCSVWRGNLMMHDEIIAVSATLVQFGFLKQIQICETILVKIAQKVANFDYVL